MDGIRGSLGVAPEKGHKFVGKTCALLSVPKATQVACQHWSGLYCFGAGFGRPLFSVLEDIFSSIVKMEDAERPEAGPGGIKYVPTVQVAMRKSLRYPPLDSVVVAATAATAAVLLSMRFSDEAAVIAGLVANGRGAAAAERLREIVLSLLPIPLPL